MLFYEFTVEILNCELFFAPLIATRLESYGWPARAVDLNESKSRAAICLALAKKSHKFQFFSLFVFFFCDWY